MNRKNKTITIIIFAAIISALVAGSAYAASPDIVTAHVDRNELTTDDVLTLSVTLNADITSPVEPILPPLDGFKIIGQSTSTSISIINGAQSAQKVYMYSLIPTQVGQLVIGPVSTKVNGTVHQTSPIVINVTQGTGQPQNQPVNPSVPHAPGRYPSMPGFSSIPGFPSISSLLNSFGFDDLMELDDPVEQLDSSEIPGELYEYNYFVEGSVDNPSPYLGEQITYRFRYYRPAQTGGVQTYQEPDFTGFWVHPEKEENQYAFHIADRSYRMTEFKYVLFPTIVGQVEIDSTIITNEGDIFNRGFTVGTEPEKVNVKPLPDGPPASFNGAVGNFTISAEVDTHETKVNDAVTLNITISGEGNLDTIADPVWQVGPEWRAFDSQVTTDIGIQEGIMVGSRFISQVLVPTKSGDFMLPAIQFSFFDPGTESYQTISTQPVDIHVEPNSQVISSAVSMDDNAITNQDQGVGSLRPIKPAPESRTIRPALTREIGFWLLWVVPLFLLVGQYGLQKRRHRILNDPEGIRSRQAAKKASRALKGVDPNSNEYYQRVGRILTNYLSDKVNQSVSGLTNTELLNLLTDHDVETDLAEKVVACLTISEMGQYAPISQYDNSNFHREVKSLIANLEKVFNRG